MNGAVLIRWGASIPGREQKSLDVFSRAVGRFEDMTKQGRLHGHREYISITGAAGGGFMMVEGETDELLKILAEEETLKLNVQAGAVAEDFEVEAYVGGTDQSIQQLMGAYAGSIKELGYM